MITILMSAYNAEKYIQASIDSILNQTYSNFEFIIFDDASSDSTVEVIQSYSDKRIRIIKNNVNKGLTKNLNTGLDLSKGRYIARMDADDISLPDRLKIQNDFLDNHKNYFMCSTSFFIIDSQSKIIGLPKNIINSKNIYSKLLIGNCIAHSSVMFRNTGLRYDETFKTCQDYKLWADLIQYNDFMILPDRLVKYRITDSSVSNQDKRKGENRIEILSKINSQIFASVGLTLSNKETILYVQGLHQLKLNGQTADYNEIFDVYLKIIKFQYPYYINKIIIVDSLSLSYIRNFRTSNFRFRYFPLFFFGIYSLIKKVCFRIYEKSKIFFILEKVDQ